MLELKERDAEKVRGASGPPRDLTHIRILVVMPTIPLYGMERKTLRIMKGLRERGAEVLFITQRDHGQNVQREVEAAGCRWVPASFDKLLGLSADPVILAGMLRAWFKSAIEFTRIRRSFEPTHIHLTNFTFFLYTWPLLSGAKEIVVFPLPTPPDMRLKRYKQLLNQFVWRFGVQRVCDHLICNSQYSLNQLGKIGVQTPKARIIHNTNTERVCTTHDAPVLDRARRHVVFVGRICEDKGVGEFVEAATRLVGERDDVDFHLAGDYRWRNPFAEGLIESIDHKGLSARVRFLGEIQDVEGLLAQCDLHVCPSVWEEPFANVVLEAKTAGVPSVIFRSGGLPEMITHEVDGFICREKTSSALYEGVKYFLDRPNITKVAGKAAKASMSRFSAEQNGKAWADVYKSCKRTGMEPLTSASSNAGTLQKARILVVMPTIPLYGMERSTLQIMKGLRERGADILFITQRDYGGKIQEEVERIGCKWVPASFDRLLSLPKRAADVGPILGAWYRSAREFNAIRTTYKPTHIFIPNLTLFLYCWPTLLGAREEIVFALPTPPDTSFGGFKRLLNSFIWRQGVLRVCDQVVCNSMFTLSRLRPMASSDQKLRVIYNAVPIRAQSPSDAPVLDRRRLNVSYVGRISAEKGVAELVEAACHIVAERDDVDFYLAGDYKWQNPFAETLMHSVEAKGLRHRIRFLGEIADIPRLLSQSDLHVCPSLCEEGLGLVVLEAKAQSIPSVVFPSGGLKETVSHLVDGYLCPDKSSAALCEGLRYFLNTPSAMRDAGLAANRSLERFSEAKATSEWVAVFSSTGALRPTAA